MKQIRLSERLAAPASSVWEVLADYGNVADWNPNLSSAHLLEGPARGIGARRRCTMKDGKNYVCEVVTAWEEGRTMSLDVFEGTMPFETASVTVVIQPSEDDTCEVVMTMDYAPRAGIGGAVMAAMAKPMLRRVFGKLFAGLQAHAKRQVARPRAARPRAIAI